MNSDLFVGKMSKRLIASDVLQLLEDDEFGLSEEEDSDFEGKSVEGYLPRMDLELCPVDNTEDMEEDEEPMDYDSSICSEDCRIQPWVGYTVKR